MTGHADALRERLAPLYRDGDLVGALIDVLGLQFEIVDERARIVQRAHWFDTTPELVEAAALGAILDIPPESGHDLGDYRAWFRAMRTARLERGAVTVEALRGFVDEFAGAFQRADGVEYIRGLGVWGTELVDTGHALVEFPPRRRVERLGRDGAAPLTRSIVQHRGFTDARADILVVGQGEGEFMPLLVNLTTGQGLLWSGAIGVGQRLWIATSEEGAVEAWLEREDATRSAVGIRRVAPGTPWAIDDVTAPAGLRLVPGANDLWFLPVAHFDHPGLDRVLLGLADLELTQGVWDASSFDHALFHQAAGLTIDLAWWERVPGTMLIDIDAPTLGSAAAPADTALEGRALLEQSLREGVAALAAAGVDQRVRFRPFPESQRQLDALVGISGRRLREVGTVGADRIRSTGGVFGVSDLDDSTYQ